MNTAAELNPTRFMCLGQQVDGLMALGEPVRFSPGTVFLHAGEILDDCYYVMTGKTVSFDMDAQGTERNFQVMEDNSLIGEAFLFMNVPLPVSFRAETEALAYRIPMDRLRSRISKDPLLLQILFESLSGKFILSMEEWRNTATRNTTWRLCNLLLMLSERYGTVQKDGTILIGRPVSQQEMAALLSVNRITVVRIMKGLREHGAVLYRRKQYAISEAELRRIMEEPEEI